MANILLVTHVFPPAVDGGSRVIAKIGEYLENQGHKLLILTSDCHNSDDFVNPRSIPFNHNLYKSNVMALSVSKHLRRPLKLINLLFRSSILKVFQKGPIFKVIPFVISFRKISRFKPDYIIAGPLPTTIVIYAHLIRFLLKALKFYRPKVLINASFHPTDPDFHNNTLIHVLKSADFVWTLTDFETNYFHKHFNIPMSKMINIGNAVDSSLLTNAPKLYGSKALTLLFIGSFAAHKGLETLIDAFVIISKALTLQSSKALTLTLAGQPTLHSPVIERKINSLPIKIRSRIKIINNFPNSKLSTLIDSCSILISPSTQESFGLVLIEAMAREKPIIASNIPAHTELIDKSGGGLLFETNDSSDLASQILKLLRSTSLSSTLSQHGYQYVKNHYTWDRIGKTIWQKISS
jgi:glycosyltransferase involved in cell wall biosynthesis